MPHTLPRSPLKCILMFARGWWPYRVPEPAVAGQGAGPCMRGVLLQEGIAAVTFRGCWGPSAPALCDCVCATGHLRVWRVWVTCLCETLGWAVSMSA